MHMPNDVVETTRVTALGAGADALTNLAFTEALAATLKRLTRYGECLGLGFQIADDVLAALTAAGFPVTAWQPGSVPRVLVFAFSEDGSAQLLDTIPSDLLLPGANASAYNPRALGLLNGVRPQAHEVLGR